MSEVSEYKRERERERESHDWWNCLNDAARLQGECRTMGKERVSVLQKQKRAVRADVSACLRTYTASWRLQNNDVTVR